MGILHQMITGSLWGAVHLCQGRHKILAILAFGDFNDGGFSGGIVHDWARVMDCRNDQE